MEETPETHFFSIGILAAILVGWRKLKNEEKEKEKENENVEHTCQ